jgi:hypothetical protein
MDQTFSHKRRRDYVNDNEAKAAIPRITPEQGQNP